jgi:glutamate/tyrosine decarboxylase-like PLP-dependent enzyme
MYMPYELGCVLVRHDEEHRNAFALTPVYLSRSEDGRGLTGGDLPWLTDYGFQLSREFRALKAWMSLKEHGSRKYGRMIQQNIDQARYLADLVEAAPELELAAPVPLNVVCFRYIGSGLGDAAPKALRSDAAPEALNGDAALDALNKEILIELQEGGIAVPSGTTVAGKYVLRVGHTNHRSRRDDFDLLVREVIRIGASKEMQSSATGPG